MKLKSSIKKLKHLQRTSLIIRQLVKMEKERVWDMIFWMDLVRISKHLEGFGKDFEGFGSIW